MKLLLYAFLCLVLLYYGCDRSHEYLDPSKEKRLSVEFLIPPSIGSPYKVGDHYIIYGVITANKDSVNHADFSFSYAAGPLTTIGIDSLIPKSIVNDRLWDVQYFAGISDTIPLAWAQKKITVQLMANGESASDTFSVK